MSNVGSSTEIIVVQKEGFCAALKAARSVKVSVVVLAPKRFVVRLQSGLVTWKLQTRRNADEERTWLSIDSAMKWLAGIGVKKVVVEGQLELNNLDD